MVTPGFASVRVMGGDTVVHSVAVWLQNYGQHPTGASRANNTDSFLVRLTGDEVALADLLHFLSHHAMSGDVRHVPIIPEEAPDPYLVHKSIVRHRTDDAAVVCA